MARREYAPKDLKLLWGLAAARCSCPDCRAELVAERTDEDPAAVVGEVAHIASHGDKGPRADSTLSAAERDRYENLILLCPTCHTGVDKQPNSFTTATLRGWKSDHERWVREQLTAEMPGVGFAELEILTRGILNTPAPASVTFVSLAPTEKLAKNGLTEPVRFQLTMGLAKAREVGAFLQSVALLDVEFPEKLKAGFVAEYRSRQAEGLSGDALFESLIGFASAGRRGFRFQAAGLAVLAYLFEACEVFER